MRAGPLLKLEVDERRRMAPQLDESTSHWFAALSVKLSGVNESSNSNDPRARRLSARPSFWPMIAGEAFDRFLLY